MASGSLAGRCGCGAITYTAQGPPLFSVLCHCQACTRACGSSPVHIVAVQSDSVRVVAARWARGLLVRGPTGANGMTRAFCADCGTILHQGPKDAHFRGILAATLDDVRPMPEELRPTAHINYESRCCDARDDLPRFVTFPDGTGWQWKDASTSLGEPKA